MKTVPFCWKCIHCLKAKNPPEIIKGKTLQSSRFMGCAENSRIRTYAGAKRYCPIKPKG